MKSHWNGFTSGPGVKLLIFRIWLGLIFFAVMGHAQAQVSVLVKEGDQVKAGIRIVLKRMLGDLMLDLPVPAGDWQVRLLETVSNTTGNASGYRLVLDQVNDRTIDELLYLDIYPNNNLNWNPGQYCFGPLLSKERGNALSGYCHSLRRIQFMSNAKSEWQARVRRKWQELKLQRPAGALGFRASYEDRGGFKIYMDYTVTAAALGLSPISGFGQDGFKGFDEWWVGNGDLPAISKLVTELERYSQFVSEAVIFKKSAAGTVPSAPEIRRMAVAIVDGFVNTHPELAKGIRPAPVAPSVSESFEQKPPSADAAKLERERLASEFEAEKEKLIVLEQKLLVEAKEKERLAAELKNKIQTATRVPDRTVSNPHALVIGNGAYHGSARLENPVNDAQSISAKLRSMGFAVTTILDADRQHLVRALAEFRRTAASADLALLFYAGHGLQVFGTNYILPVDVSQDDPAQATIQGLSLASVVENFLPGRIKLVFLDACRDNPLQRTGDRSISKGLAPMATAQGTLISYATKDGQTAADGVGQKNSPFTQALLQHMDDPTDIAVILRRVREKVMQATGGRQQPWEYGSLIGGELVISSRNRNE